MKRDEIKSMVKIILKNFPSGINTTNMTEMLIETMTLAGRIRSMSGEDKKQLVIETLNEVFDQTEAGRYDTEIDVFLKTAVPILIDQLVSVDNGELKINPIVASCGCFPR